MNQKPLDKRMESGMSAKLVIKNHIASKVTLHSINPFGVAALGSIFAAVKDFAFAHPIIAGIVGLSIGIAVLLKIWRKYFPVSYYLWKILFFEAGRTRNAAEEALLKIGFSAVPRLIKELRSSVQADFIKAVLRKIKDPRVPELLIEALDDDDYEIRNRAAELLGDMKVQQALDPLIKASKKCGHRSESIIKALYLMKDHRGIESIVKALKNEPVDDSEVSRSRMMCSCKYTHAHEYLLRMGESAIPYLINGSEDDSEYVSAKAVEVLQGMGGSKSVDAIIKALKSKHYKTRNLAALYLGESRGAEVVTALINALNDPSFDSRLEFRRTVIKSLGKTKDARATEPLIKFLSNEKFELRSLAADALDEIGWKSISQELHIQYLFAKGQHADLAKIDYPAIRYLLETIFLNNSVKDSVRQNAAYCLLRMKDPRLSFITVDYVGVLFDERYGAKRLKVPLQFTLNAVGERCKNLTREEIEYIVDCLKNGKKIEAVYRDFTCYYSYNEGDMRADYPGYYTIVYTSPAQLIIKIGNVRQDSPK